jgi:membrane fusion protein (multidrug efflux system)
MISLHTSKRHSSWASLLVAGCAILAGCGQDKPGGGPPGPGGGPGAMPPPEVPVMTVAAGNATVTQTLPGRLEAARTAQVRARVEGLVEKRLFVEGSDVTVGTPLYQIDAATYRAAAASAEADVAVAKLTVERYRPLVEIQAVSQQEFDQASAKLKQAQATLARARLDLDNTRVPAAISGRIGRSLVTEGALVGKGEATLLATIEQIDPIYVTFTQPSAAAMVLQRAVQAGRAKRAEKGRVEMLLEDGSVYGHAGQLLFSDMAVDPNTGSIQMRALFPNPQRLLLPGTFVRVRVSQSEAEGVVKVPQSAVQVGSQGQYLMIVDKDGKAVVLPVAVGSMAGTDWIISQGLKGGEQVIVDGLQKVRPGMPVKAVPTSVSAPATAK